MLQRYTVFLNDRAVKICRNIATDTCSSDDMMVYYTGKAALMDAYGRFNRDAEIPNLVIITDTNLPEAWRAFNSLFIRIEAAGGIVRNAKEEYLFIKRFGIWDLPKGKLHKKESAAEGALREVTEETGLLNLRIIRQLASTYHIYTDRNGEEVLKKTSWFEMWCNGAQEPIPQSEEDITEVKWFGARDLNIPIENTYTSLRHLLSGYI